MFTAAVSGTDQYPPDLLVIADPDQDDTGVIRALDLGVNDYVRQANREKRIDGSFAHPTKAQELQRLPAPIGAANHRDGGEPIRLTGSAQPQISRQPYWRTLFEGGAK